MPARRTPPRPSTSTCRPITLTEGSLVDGPGSAANTNWQNVSTGTYNAMIRNGAWGAPVFMELEKGSWGLQIGAQAIDLVLLVMNRNGMDKLLSNKVKLGAEASVAAGPVGRDARAGTDAQMKAEILSYSRAQGLFAGIDISGGALKPDVSDTEDLYGKGATPRSIVMQGSAKAPAETKVFLDALARGAVGTAGKK